MTILSNKNAQYLMSGDFLEPDVEYNRSKWQYENSTFMENIADTWETHLWDEGMTKLKAYNQPIEEDFDWMNQAKTLFPELLDDEKHIQELSMSESQGDMQIRGNNIKQNLESKAIMQHANFGYHALLNITAYAIQDPLTWTPIGMKKWGFQSINSLAKFSKQSLKYGSVMGASVAPYEFARIGLDPTAETSELAYTIPTAIAIGGVIGPVLGKIFKGTLDSKTASSVIKSEILDDPAVEKIIKPNGRKTTADHNKELIDNKIDIVDVDGIPIRKLSEESDELAVPYGGPLYQGSRKILSRPYGLEQSEYDMIKDIGLLWKRDKSFTESVNSNDMNFILDLPDELVGDMSTMLFSNATRATPQSVDTLYKQNWFGEMYTVRGSIDNGWASMNNIKTTTQGSPDLSKSFQGIDTTVSKADFFDTTSRYSGGLIGTKQNISKSEFKREVAKQIIKPNKDAHPEIIKTAKNISDVYKKFQSEIDRSGLGFTEQNLKKQLVRQQERLEYLQTYKKSKYANEDTSTRIKEVKDEIGDIENALIKLKEQGFGSTKSGENYFPMFWNVGKIRQNKDFVIKKLTEEFKRDMPSGAKKRATETVNRMIREEGHFENSGFASKTIKNLMSRKLDVKGDWKFDYLDLDVETVTRNYIRRMGANIEMAKFGNGDRLLTKKLDDIKEKFSNFRKGVVENKKIGPAETKKRLEKLDIQEYEILDHVETLRDRVLGTFVSGSQAHSWQARTSRVLKNMGITLLAGKFTLNSIADLGTIGLRYGVKNHFGTLIKKHLNPNKDPQMERIFLEGKRESKIFASAIDTVMHSANARMMEFDGIVPGSRSSFEDGLESMANAMFKANMLNYWTTAQKEFATVLSIDSIIKDSVRLAKKFKESNNSITDDVANDWMRLRSLGFKDKDILDMGNNTGGVSWKRVDFKNSKVLEEHKRIGWEETKAKMTEEDYKYVADTDSWKNEALASRFGTAIHNDVNIAVMTPSIATRPGFLEGQWKGIPHTKSFAKRKIQAQKEINAITRNIKSNNKKLKSLGVKFDSENSTSHIDFIKSLSEGKADSPKTLIAKKQLEEYENLNLWRSNYSSASRNYQPLLSLMFQFRTFGISAATKIAGTTIQQQARYPKQGIVALMGLAYLSQWAKNPQSFSNKDIGEQLLISAEYSGASSWLIDFNNTVETLSQNTFGVRPAFGMDEKFSYEDDADRYASVAGTPFVAPVNIIKFLTGQTLGGGKLSDRERLKLFYRTISFNNLFFLDPPLGLSNYFGGPALVDKIADTIFDDPDANSYWERQKKKKNARESLK